MKELYTFVVERKIEKEETYLKKSKGQSVEATRKVIESKPHRIVLAKPNHGDIEDAEFFYGQKYNELINAGFLTKAMLAKKMGDSGGMSSKLTSDRINRLFLDNMEASKTVEFFSGSKNLTEEQKEQLKQAEETFIGSKKELAEYEEMMNAQFRQTADAKAEQKLIEWLVFHFSYYEDEIDEKKQLFPVFKGDDYEEKREFYLTLAGDEEDIDDAPTIKVKKIYDESFNTLIRAINIWYNKMGTDQESIDKVLKELFDE